MSVPPEPPVDVDQACLPDVPPGRFELPPLRDAPFRAARTVLVGPSQGASRHRARIVCGLEHAGEVSGSTASGVLVDPDPDGDGAVAARCRRVNERLPAGWIAIGGRGEANLHWAVDFATSTLLAPERVRTRWADAPSCFADVILPPRVRRGLPLVVHVHGGFWRPRWTLDTTASIGADLAVAGYPVVNLEYPVPDEVADGAAMTQRVLEGVPPLIESVAVSGGSRRVVLVGHSAGGQLAALLAVELASRIEVAGLVLQAAILDLVDAHRRHLGGRATTRLVPADARGAEAYLAELSPRHRLDRLPLPTLLVHGRDDDRVPVEMSRSFAAEHPEVELVELSRAHHLDHLSPDSEAWRLVRRWSLTGDGSTTEVAR